MNNRHIFQQHSNWGFWYQFFYVPNEIHSPWRNMSYLSLLICNACLCFVWVRPSFQLFILNIVTSIYIQFNRKHCWRNFCNKSGLLGHVILLNFHNTKSYLPRKSINHFCKFQEILSNWLENLREIRVNYRKHFPNWLNIAKTCGMSVECIFINWNSIESFHRFSFFH